MALAVAELVAVLLVRHAAAAAVRLGDPRQHATDAGEHVRERRDVRGVVDVGEHARVRGGQREAPLVVVDQAGDGLLLQPFARVAGRDAGAVGELVRRERAVALERLVQPELGSEVDGEQLERAERGFEEPLGELVGAIGGDHALYGVRWRLTSGVRLASHMPSFVGRESESGASPG